MSVGLLIIAHQNLGPALLECATTTLGELPLSVEALSVQPDGDPDQMFEDALQLYRQLDSGDGVLVLTDLYGSTPCNIACRLLREAELNLAVISGLNLSMLMRLFSYPDLSLDALLTKADSGGRDGIIACSRENSASETSHA